MRSLLKLSALWLTTFSVTFLAGVLAGGWGRFEVEARSLQVGVLQFPWEGTNEPATAAEALDWIATQAHLQRLGFSPEQARELYELQATIWNEADDPWPFRFLSAILAEVPTPAAAPFYPVADIPGAPEGHPMQ